mmetsp:Transcript_13166/g.29998  ORF Transcript_13166/g.29998 Transcript_13166/m.29998 type:complete len:550 (-) Transcript_13166:32-1681(-)
MQRLLTQLAKLVDAKVACVVVGGLALYAVAKKAAAKRQRWPVKALQGLRTPVTDEERLRIVIIGGGIGGTFAAMWLREMFGDRVDLVIIQSGLIGGRCKWIEMVERDKPARRYECGASIISELNEYVLDAMKVFNLEKKESTFVPLAIWDGSKVLFREAFLKSPTASALLSAFRVLQRYGLRSLRRLKRMLMSDPGLPDFQQLYRHLQDGAAFRTPKELLVALTRGGGTGCVELTQESSQSFFSKMDISRAITDELVQGGMRSNYGGQTLQQLHALVGLISVAGGIASSCFRIKGGNVQLMERALEAAKARVICGTARVVRPAAGPTSAHSYEVLYDSAEREYMIGNAPPGPSKGTTQLQADVVVLAHHLATGSVKVEGVEAELKPGSLRRCCTHFLQGSLKAEAFGLPAGEPAPLEVLTVGDGAPFYSIGVQAPIDASKKEAAKLISDLREGGVGTFKVFAPQELSVDELSKYFTVVPGSLQVVDWYAYPAYHAPEEFMPFVLAKGLIYLNAVETIGSAMEMSAIAARNAVNLVREWYPSGCRPRAKP